MGSQTAPPDWDNTDEEDDEPTARLGDVLSGRFANLDIDSVEAVREHRERR